MQASESKPKPLRVCFVGCGSVAKYHFKAAVSTGRVHITCLVDPNPAARSHLMEMFQCLLDESTSRESSTIEPQVLPTEFDSLADALAADPFGVLFEACVLMVPSFLVDGADLHEELASLALRAKRHVMLEKPVAVSVEAAQRLVALHREVASERVFSVAENAQFWPEVIAAKACIDRGEIGEVITARAKFWESAGGPWADDYLPGTWRCDASKLPSASFTYDGASHWIRPLRMFLGEVAAVAGTAGRALDHMPGVSWSQHILSFTSGKSAIFESILAPKGISDQPFFTVQGTLGEIVIDGFDGGCRLYLLGGEKGMTVQETSLCKEGWDAGYRGEYEDFASAVLDGHSTLSPISEGVEDLRVIVAIFKAAETGQLAKVDLL